MHKQVLLQRTTFPTIGNNS